MIARGRVPIKMGDVRIREATEADASAVEEIHSSAIQAVDRSFYSDREIQSWGGRVNPERWQSFPEILTKSVFLVAEQEGRLLGFAQLVTDEHEVRAVYVRPEVSGKGSVVRSSLRSSPLLEKGRSTLWSSRPR
jgi:L-amino acid N-acyltransferase YncA